MSAIDEIRDLLGSLESAAGRREQLAKFEGLLSEVAVALGTIVEIMEKPADTSITTALSQALQNLQIKSPEVTVNVPQAAAPTVNVAAPAVTVMPSASGPKGWTLTVNSRDGNGNIRTLSFKPEN